MGVLHGIRKATTGHARVQQLWLRKCERSNGPIPPSRAYNVEVRHPVCIALLLSLAACRSGTPQHPNAVVDQNKAGESGHHQR